MTSGWIENELAVRQTEIRQLQIRIENQELSAEDVQQISKERQRLNEQCNMAASRQKETQNNIWRQETFIAEQMDKLEAYVQRYAMTATRMKLLPALAKNANGFDYDIEIDAHTGGVEAAQQLSLHLKQNVRAALLRFKKNRQDRTQIALDEVLQLQAQVETSRELLKMDFDEEQKMEARVRKLEDNIRREKDMWEAATAQKLQTAEDLEVQIESILNEGDLSAEGVQANQHLDQLKKTYVLSSVAAALFRETD
jgi:SMC interacting uncharacterized protein involved in chromosome segregation